MLDARAAEIGETRMSKKQPLSDAEAAALLKSVDEVVLARGKAYRALKAKEASIEDLRGPTGGFRAPMLKVGRRLLVGFHDETLKTLLKG